ncbi:hypothetical protein [Labrys monachus]|uniref:Uncharacterized protein n=1 Tax=Labrys monachus TaxID=217067 RepID=A0ABU0FND3_9HYPH|nr:hypothetical protein [Labrys monachus]MDQ0396036.1 hypothetical protein [Labrys monachus]
MIETHRRAVEETLQLLQALEEARKNALRRLKEIRKAESERYEKLRPRERNGAEGALIEIYSKHLKYAANRLKEAGLNVAEAAYSLQDALEEEER